MSEKKPAEKPHALLGASSAHIWLKCTAMPRACEGVEDPGSIYAQEGTLAHEIAELKLRKNFLEPMARSTYSGRMKRLEQRELYNEEMQRYTDEYVEFVKSLVYSYDSKPHVAVEAQLDFSKYAPEGFGTGDCIVVGGDTLCVIDFKYGKGKLVHAFENPQIMFYGLGALEAYDRLYDIKNIEMTIFQPRLENVSTFKMTREDLIKWGDESRVPAQKAFYGFGTFVPSEECQFCNIKGNCRARAEQNLGAIKAHATGEPPALPKGALLALSEVGEVLTELKRLGAGAWIKAIEGYGLAQAMSGEAVPGWKVVEGSSKRAFTDYDAVAKAFIKAGYDKALLYHQAPETLTTLEGLVGRAKVAELAGDNLIKTPGKPTLVPDSAPGEPITQNTAADDFSTPPTEEPKTVKEGKIYVPD